MLHEEVRHPVGGYPFPPSLGWVGRREFLEPQVREVVADELGVASGELRPEVSLLDDLAADSLDLLELALALERRFGIALSESQLATVHTYRDLVDVVITACVSPVRELPAVSVRAVLRPFGGRRQIERVGWLTPYLTELITAEAVQAGRGTTLEVMVRDDDPSAAVNVLERFGWLADRGIVLVVGGERTRSTRRLSL